MLKFEVSQVPVVGAGFTVEMNGSTTTSLRKLPSKVLLVTCALTRPLPAFDAPLFAPNWPSQTAAPNPAPPAGISPPDVGEFWLPVEPTRKISPVPPIDWFGNVPF